MTATLQPGFQIDQLRTPTNLLALKAVSLIIKIQPVGAQQRFTELCNAACTTVPMPLQLAMPHENTKVSSNQMCSMTLKMCQIRSHYCSRFYTFPLSMLISYSSSINFNVTTTVHPATRHDIMLRHTKTHT